jgi:hypothetical protein
VYRTPHHGIKIRSGDKRIVIDQKFIEQKYKEAPEKHEKYQPR